MDYKIVLMHNAENDLDSFISYLLFEKRSKQAAGNLLNDFEATKVSLSNVAGSLKLCDNPMLRELGYRRINFLYHRYFMLYRIEKDTVYVDNIFHELQDKVDEIMLRFNDDKKKITIISQNLYNYRKKNIRGLKQVDLYQNKYKADVYAFQEYPEFGRGKTFYTTFCVNNEESKGSVNEVEALWKEHFPWSNFPQRYWAEINVLFNKVEIRVINVHIPSTTDQDQLRFVLLKRLEQLKYEPVILLGDFNAAFSYQTDKVVQGNNLFMSLITKKGYKEICGEKENNIKPHYTFALKSSKTKSWEKKKLDHIFMSSKLDELGFNMDLKYIDDVNINLQDINGIKPLDAFTDHSGLKLVIESENP
jgi:hypothetical protein